MSGGFRKSFEWRKVALFVCAASLGASAVACGSDKPVDDESSKSNEDDEADDEATDDEDTDESKPVNKPDAKVDASKPSPTKDAGTADAKPPVANNTNSLWCQAQPVIQKYCADCHQADAVGPMELITFDDFMAEAPITKGKKVYEVTKARIHDTKKPMPPSEKLSADELKAIDDWIADGAKPGSDPTCDGKAIAPTGNEDPTDGEVWPTPGCETSYKILAGGTKPATIAANAETHPQFVSDAPWGTQTVQGVGFRSITDNKKVLHHWILYDNKRGPFINGWAPGKDSSKQGKMPADVGSYLPNGAQSLRLDMHYYNVGNNSAAQDASGVEICVTTKPRKYAATTFMNFMAIPIIPPGKHDIVGTCNVQVKEPVFLLSESPHAHTLATWMKLTVKRGSQVFTLHDAAFDFNEQVSRPLDEPFELKNGDVVTTTCTFDNNLQPAKTVTFGENTGNEMCFNFTGYYPMGALSCAGGGGLAGIGGESGLAGVFGGN